LRVYPNPYIPNDSIDDNGIDYDMNTARGGIFFDNCPVNSTLDIFTLQGFKIVTLYSALSHSIQWNTLNSAGRKVASGIYFYHISDASGNRKTGKIVIVR